MSVLVFCRLLLLMMYAPLLLPIVVCRVVLLFGCVVVV